MLIRFTVSNFLSFKEEVEFSMIPGKSRNHDDHIIKGKKRNSIPVLKAGVIYGANASGKSNLIKAIHFGYKFIVAGTGNRKFIKVNPFKFDRAYAHLPSKFEFEFIIDDMAYAYGFELDSKKIHREWLYEISRTNQKKIFERTLIDNQVKIEFGSIKHKVKDEESLMKLLKPSDSQLFLNQTEQAGMTLFKPIISWFQELIFIFPETRYAQLETDLDESDSFRSFLSRFMGLFNTGISEICLSDVNLEELSEIPEMMRKDIQAGLEPDTKIVIRGVENSRYLISMDENNEIRFSKLMAKHNYEDEKGKEEILLELSEESDGTLRLLDLLPAFLMAVVGSRVCFIDEFDRSLHPELSTKMLDLFFNGSLSGSSQLIVTTHEASLLDLELLRRDEIWFVEKKRDSASSIYSLEEFAPRYDKDIRKGYILGRFGAIPFITVPHKFLIEDDG